jgi:hypothetical protein
MKSTSNRHNRTVPPGGGQQCGENAPAHGLEIDIPQWL